ncbi:MAG: S-layer homology domain-containing protein [Hominilimicola sp.]
MRKKQTTKRAIAALLSAAMCVSCFPMNAFAQEDELSPEALRVSDEFAQKYPNGMLDIVNQNTITNEEAGEIQFYVARRGGTEGEVDVSVKAIEMTAKYGEDFVFVEDGLFSSHEVEKAVDSPTLLESSIIDYGDEPVTIESTDTADNADIDNTAEDMSENIESEKNTDNNESSDDIIEENPTENISDEESQPQAVGFDENREYSSSLHKMRDEILNKSTKAEVTADTELTKLFDVENKDDVMRDEAMSAVMPGAFINLHFDDGENYKIFKIKILDDDIVEDDEAFMLGLFDCEGAELGNNATSNICIQDNDDKSEETELYFEEDYINAYDQNSTVRLKLMRSNNIETYQLLQVQTMGNTATADKNYSSLVTEAVLLAGQEYKYIDIPILKSNITEPVDFEVRVSGTGCNEVSALVTIFPTDADNGIMLMSADDLSRASDSQPVITIEGKSYNGSSYADSGRLVTWNNPAGYVEGGVELNADKHRWGYLFYDLDLRGIEKLKVKAEGTWSDTSYPSRVQHEIYIEGGGKKVSKQKNWGPEEFTFASNEFTHKVTRLAAHADSNWHNDTRLWIHYIKLYKQQIVLSFEQPDAFKIPIYSDDKNIAGYYTEDGQEKVVAPQSSISALNKDSSRPSKYYRDDTVTLTSSLSSDGKKYGAYLKGYELYNPSTQKYTYFEGTNLTLTPSIIGAYVYGDNTKYASTLKIKPVYGRKAVESKLTVGNYATHKGSIEFGGDKFSPNTVKNYKRLTGFTNVSEIDLDTYRTVYTYPWLSVEEYTRMDDEYTWMYIRGERTYENAKWCVGDYIAVTLNPADGYTASAINDANGNKISEGTSNKMYVQLKESGNCIVPVFNRNDCGVTFLYEGETNGLYVFHDKKTYADSAFLNELYKGTSGLTNWSNDASNDTIPVFTGLLNNKIKSNYDILRTENKLNGQKLSNLAIGDVVTVYAEAPEGYIPYWYIDDGQKTITTENDKIYARHYGNSFSFEMTSNDVTLYCGMEKKTAENYVMTGKLVKPSQTLKGEGYAQVNPGIPQSYMTVPGAALSVINFDERKDSIEIDGIKYYSSVTTGADGNFKMYVPNVSEREYFSVKYANGVQTKATTLLAANGKTYYIVVPANDVNYTVKSIDCRTMLGDLAETNGLIKIPYSSTGANRSFLASTVCANENYKISAVKLNSYRKDGSRIKSIDMMQTSSVGLETNWRSDVNIAEVLADGGRLTVEVFDKNGNSRGEVETGYKLEQELAPTNVSFDGMPDEFSNKGLSNVPIVGSNVPTVPGSRFVEQPNDKTMEIAVGQGETLKKAIYSQLEEFNNSDNWSKLMYLTNYITDTYNVNVSNSKSEQANEDDELGSSTKFPILFDFGMYMKLDKNEDGTLSLNYVFVTVGMKGTYTAEWQWVLCGIPLYVTLSAGGTARGLFGVNGTTDYFSNDNVKDKAFYALLGKYGQDGIENKNYSIDDETDQNLFAALYNQSNLTKDKSQAADVLDNFDKDKQNKTASAIDDLLDRYDFYYINEDIFEKKSSGFSGDLQNRISMYKQLVTVTQRFEPTESESPASTASASPAPTREPFEPDLIIDYDKDQVKQAWIHRLNLLLLLESLPEYLDDGKTTYDISAEHCFGLDFEGNNAITGIVSLQPSFSVGVGAGLRGALSIGISGHLDFVINWQPWSEARGTVTFAVNADIDILIIPLSVRLIGYTAEMFRTDGYLDSGFDIEEGGSGMLASLMSFAESDTYSSVNTSPNRRSGNNSLERVEKISLMASYDDGLHYVDNTMDYQTETTKHPQPNMFLLPNGNKLIIYMNDNLDRGLYDRNSIYYSVFDKNTQEWSESTELEEDGTLDGDIETLQLADGRVIVVWTNSDRTFGDDLPDMADLVTSQNISLCIFDESGNPGAIHDITNLEAYGYSEPALSCIGDVLTVSYKITDYHTSGVEFDYDDIENTYQSFMSSSYESLAVSEFDMASGQIIDDSNSEYALYEQNSGINLGGMRFVDTDMTGLENPKLYDIKQAAFNGNTYIVYSVDTDNNASTKNDRELFCIIRENGANSKPIRLTDNQVNDANANIVVNDMMNKIYFGSGSNICTINLEDINAENWEDKGSYYVMKNAGEQTDSVLEYQSEEAADGFKIFEGGNGVLYMLWTEFKTSTDDDKKVHKNRALYMKAYDPMFMQSEYEDEAYGVQSVYTGSWGLTNEILSETDMYINEPSMVVSADNEYSIAYRLFEMDEQTENGVAYEKEQDTSTMCVSDFELVTSISATKTNQYPLYPRERETVSLDFKCENYGTIPSEMIQFNYYIETDADIEGYDEFNDCWWSKGDGENTPVGKSFAVIKESALFEGHMAAGANLGDTVQFVMPPYEKEVSIYVMAWEDDITNAEISKIPVTVAPELEAYDLNTTLSDDEQELRIQGTVRNIGNYLAENVVLKIYADGTYDAGDILFDNENTDFGEDMVEQVVGEFTIASLAPDETYNLDYTIVSENNEEGENTRATITKKSKLSGKYFTSDGKATFTLEAEYDTPAQENGAALFATITKKSKVLGSTYAQKSNNNIPTLTNISVDIPSEGSEIALFSNDSTLKVPVGETKELNITLEPYGSAKGYSLIYESADNSVAQINSSNGEISGISEGTTTVTIKAVKNDRNDIVLVDFAGEFWLNDGSLWDFVNDTGTNDSEVVMTKEITVAVTPAEVKPTTRPSHSGGSSVKPTPTPTQAPIPTEPDSPSESNNQFVDVPENAWYYNAVKYAFEKGLMLGVSDTEFAPESELTRAMFVTVLYRMENEPNMSDEILGYPFEDVEAESWYTDAVYWARLNGIVNGVSDEKFAPDDNITREQMAAIMFRYAKYKGIAPTGEWAIHLDYADLDDVSDWATEAVMYCKLNGIMQGKDNNCFAPKDNSTRAETAAILQRLSEKEYKSELGYSIVYNPTEFILDNSGDHDTFTYNTKEMTEAPIYITVQPYSDMDVKTVADGLILQSGIDGIEATEVYFGADSIKTQNVYIEKEVDGVKQIQVFYVIPVDDGSMIVEIGSYVDVSEKTDSIIEEMLGTFSLKKAE